jgi:hypothetical protein
MFDTFNPYLKGSEEDHIWKFTHQGTCSRICTNVHCEELLGNSPCFGTMHSPHTNTYLTADNNSNRVPCELKGKSNHDRTKPDLVPHFRVPSLVVQVAE